ncbi:MAG: histidine phosphatase family protein, partial [bacterium]|nr:histidine phosphatase family protein [bacterium]
TDFNTRGIYQGQLDSPLTEEGVAQAQALAPRIQALHSCTTLYSSDLGRARHTARLIAAPQHQLSEDADLGERNFGIFQGLMKAEIPLRHPEEWALHQSGDPEYVVPGGESQRQLQERVLAAMDRIVVRHPGELIVAVTHGGALGAMAKHALGLDLSAPRRFEVGNTSISQFNIDDNRRWMVRFLGDQAHLETLPEANQTEA